MIDSWNNKTNLHPYNLCKRGWKLFGSWCNLLLVSPRDTKFFVPPPSNQQLLNFCLAFGYNGWSFYLKPVPPLTHCSSSLLVYSRTSFLHFFTSFHASSFFLPSIKHCPSAYEHMCHLPRLKQTNLLWLLSSPPTVIQFLCSY